MQASLQLQNKYFSQLSSSKSISKQVSILATMSSNKSLSREVRQQAIQLKKELLDYADKKALKTLKEGETYKKGFTRIMNSPRDVAEYHFGENNPVSDLWKALDKGWNLAVTAVTKPIKEYLYYFREENRRGVEEFGPKFDEKKIYKLNNGIILTESIVCRDRECFHEKKKSIIYMTIPPKFVKKIAGDTNSGFIGDIKSYTDSYEMANYALRNKYFKENLLLTIMDIVGRTDAISAGLAFRINMAIKNNIGYGFWVEDDGSIRIKIDEAYPNKITVDNKTFLITDILGIIVTKVKHSINDLYGDRN